ncbi:MAG TPA: hypothetical protein VFJ70_22145 [Burkholderiales bacterium]|nr:hypothetical protein [Burkholderiales bacterium]
MPLLVSVRRELHELEFGAHPALVLRYDELRRSDGETPVVRHRNNRWIADTGEEFATLEILGPLIVTPAAARTPPLGPYQRLSVFDGVAYVDGRVFAFMDVQQQDWYVHDAGAHWPAMRISFHRTGP